MNNTRLIDLEEIFKIYIQGDIEIRALDKISLCIKQGEFVAIVGSSGSGKSTLMNMLGCLDAPTYGSYCLDGENVSSLRDKELSYIRNRKIGFIFQGFNLISGLTALENVELPLVYRKLPKAQRKLMAIEAMKLVSLENRMHHRPSEMSGGQQQRVAIARAIAGEPSIILADEPTGNLDSASGNEVMAILRNLHKNGKTIILITHDTKIASQANRVICISDGKIESDS